MLVLLITTLLSYCHCESLQDEKCQSKKTNLFYYGCSLWTTECEGMYAFNGCTKDYCKEYTTEREKKADGTTSESTYCSKYGTYVFDERNCLTQCCGSEVSGATNTFAGGYTQKCKDANTQGFINILKFIGAVIAFFVGGFLILMIIAGCVEGWKRLRNKLRRTRMPNLPDPINKFGSFKHMEFEHSEPDDEDTNDAKNQEMMTKN